MMISSALVLLQIPVWSIVGFRYYWKVKEEIKKKKKSTSTSSNKNGDDDDTGEDERLIK